MVLDVGLFLSQIFTSRWVTPRFLFKYLRSLCVKIRACRFVHRMVNVLVIGYD